MRVFTLFIALIILPNCNQPPSRIKIDGFVSKEIDSLISSNRILGTSLEGQEYLFHIENTYDYNEFIQNDASDINYFLNIQTLLKKQYTMSVCDCLLSKDTIIIQGGMGYSGGITFITKIYGTKFDNYLLLETTQKLYSKTNNKNGLTSQIELRSFKNQLILTEKPEFRVGYKIKGKGSIKPEGFYQLDNKNNLVKIKTEFDIVFNCEIKEYSSF